MPAPLIGICMDFIAETAPSGRDKSYLKLYPQYPQAVARAGGIPVALPVLPHIDALRPILGRLGGVVLVGSDDYPSQWYGEPPDPATNPCTPQRCDFDRAFVRVLYEETGLPVLAICGGMQVTAIHYGGAMIQHIPRLCGKVVHLDDNLKDCAHHSVRLEQGTALARAMGVAETVVNSLHHQAVKAAAGGWRVAAQAEDGIIEAMEDPRHRFRVATQWHPERMDDEPHQRLWRAFVQACAR